MLLSARILSSVSLIVPGEWRPGAVFNHSMRLPVAVGWVEYAQSMAFLSASLPTAVSIVEAIAASVESKASRAQPATRREPGITTRRSYIQRRAVS